MVEIEQTESDLRETQKECDDLNNQVNEYKQQLVKMKMKVEQEEEFHESTPSVTEVKVPDDPDKEELLQQNHSVRFMNQLLVQQLAEERKRQQPNGSESDIEMVILMMMV